MDDIIQFGIFWLLAVTIIILAVRCAALARTVRKLTGILYRQTSEAGFFRKQVSDDLEIIADQRDHAAQLNKQVLAWQGEYSRLVQEVKKVHPDFKPPFINLKSTGNGSK